MIDFEPEPAVVDLRERVRAFVRDVVIPAEPRDLAAHGLDDALRRELQDEARRAGVFAPQVPAELGGLGLDTRSVAGSSKRRATVFWPRKRSIAPRPTKATCTCWT